MSVRRILVHLDGPETVGRLVPAAVELARDLGATDLTLVAALEVQVPVTGAGLSLGLLQAREHDLLNLVDSMEERARASSSGMAVDWRSLVSPDAQNRLSRWAVRADLLIMSSPPAIFGGVEVGETLVTAGRPVIVAPRSARGFRLDRVLIAFKPTREGRAALTAALPLAQRARRVLLATIGDSATDEDVDDALAYLRAHEIAVDAETVRGADDRDAGAVLLDLARHDHSDVLVAGAYGHGRVRERVFGGATRTLLEHASLPCLMIH
jgi:nucleotide-binding universal stress UspA family protein